MIYFTSDLHIGHNKDFLYGARGFNSIEEHDQTLLTNWNNLITDEDTVYILGDVMLNNNDYGCKIFNQLIGHKIIIRGNHDTDNRINIYKQLDNVREDIPLAELFKYGKYRFLLTHFPTMTMPLPDLNIHEHTINLSGHTHFKEKFYMNCPGIYNVAVDAHNMTPVSIEEIIKDIEEEVQRQLNHSHI